MIEREGGTSVNRKVGDLALHTPKSIDRNALLYEASAIFQEAKVDTLVVTDNGKAIGLIDVQDIIQIKE